MTAIINQTGKQCFSQCSVPHEGRQQLVSLAAVAASLHPLSVPATAYAVPKSYGISSVGFDLSAVALAKVDRHYLSIKGNKV